MKPCESPIEDIFVYGLRKYIDEELRIEPQIWSRTEWGNFRMDFVVRPKRGGPDPGIAFECDGYDAHEGRTFQDELRDAMILSSGTVRRIWRLRGGQIFHALEDALWCVSCVHPLMFSERGRINLEILASAETKATRNPMHGAVSFKRTINGQVYTARLLWRDLKDELMRDRLKLANQHKGQTPDQIRAALNKRMYERAEEERRRLAALDARLPVAEDPPATLPFRKPQGDSR